MKNNLVRLSLLIIVLVQFGYIAYTNLNTIPDLKNTVSELNKGAEIDFAYINKVNEYQSLVNDAFLLQNDACVAAMSYGDMDTFNKNLAELNRILPRKPILEEEILDIKDQRSEFMSQAKFATVYKPE